MLHRINSPSGVDRLGRIVQFQREVLVYACNPATPLSPVENEIKAAFTAGDWLWERLKPTAKGGATELRRGLEEAIAYCRTNPAEAQQIIDAFDHDIEFDKHLNDPAFQFHYKTRLSTPAQVAIRGLFEAFYTDLLFSGYPECVQGQKASFNRDSFVQAFYQANGKLRVCSACDGPRPDTKVVNRKSEKTFADADHFFPKSEYPLLSMHPANLVPICISCNRIFKLAKDPIDDHNNEPLLHSFHPYLKPAVDHIKVVVTRNATGERQVAIQETGGMKSRRINRLDHLFSLETRWPDRLKDVQNSVFESLGEWRRLITRFGGTPDAPTLRAQLKDIADEKEKADEMGKIPWQIPHASYLRFVLNDKDEFDLMLTQFRGY